MEFIFESHRKRAKNLASFWTSESQQTHATTHFARRSWDLWQSKSLQLRSDAKIQNSPVRSKFEHPQEHTGTVRLNLFPRDFNGDFTTVDKTQRDPKRIGSEKLEQLNQKNHVGKLDVILVVLIRFDIASIQEKGCFCWQFRSSKWRRLSVVKGFRPGKMAKLPSELF